MATYRNQSPDDPVNPPEVEHLLEHNPVEERALEIAQSEGRDRITADDRARAREELRAPNEITHAPEVGAKVGNEEPSPWDEPPGRFGRKVPTLRPDSPNIGKELVEKGLRGPGRSRSAPKTFPT